MFPHRIALSLALLLAASLALLGCSDSNALHGSDESAEAQQAPEARLRVRAEPVRLAQFASADRVTGTARAFHRAIITAEMQGRVVARHVESGAHVEKGGLLIELESSRLQLEVRRSQASLGAARTDFAHAKRDADRAEQLFAESAISTRQHDDLRHAFDRARDDVALAEVARDTARRNLEDTKIRAPFSGTVDSLSVDLGDFVMSGTPVANLVDLSRVRIFGGITAGEAARLRAGSPAKVSFEDLGGAVFHATLQSVGRVAGDTQGTYEIELWMDPGEVTMRDGLVAKIDLPNANQAPSLLVRRAAILRREGHPEVFVVSDEAGGHVVHERQLRTGRSEGEWIEILEGLEQGDLVVWDGHFALEDGSTVVIDGTPSNFASVESSD